MIPFHYDGKEYTGNARKVTADHLSFALDWLTCYEPSEDEGEEKAREIADLIAWLEREVSKKERKAQK